MEKNLVNIKDMYIEQLPYDDFEKTIANKTDYIKILNGKWKSKLLNKQEDDSFVKINEDNSDWNFIKIPENYESEKCNKNKYYAKAYRKTFVVPENFLKRQVFIHVDINSQIDLWINGEMVEGLVSLHNYNITNYINDEVNEIVIKSYKDDNRDASFEILGDVYIYSEPKTYINDIYVYNKFDYDYKNSDLFIWLKIKSEKKKKIRLSLYLFKEGDFSEDKIIEDKDIYLLKDQEEILIKKNIKNPKKWSDEQPNLYTLIFCIKDEIGNIIEIKKTNYGFRVVEIRNEKILINGKPIKLLGLNLKEYNFDRSIENPSDRYIEDILRFKKNNINAVRLDYSRLDPYFYKLCDEYGIYIIEEMSLNNETRKIKNVIERDKNHPSIIIWSLNSENSLKDIIPKIKNQIKSIDKTRAINIIGDIKNSDIFSRYYGSRKFMDLVGNHRNLDIALIDKIKNKFSEVESVNKKDYRGKPAIFLDYAYSSGNGLGSLKEYIDKFYRYDNWVGGFMHSYKNQLLDPCQYEIKKVYQKIIVSGVDELSGKFQVENRFSFTDLKKFNLKWTLYEDGFSIKETMIEDIECEPLEKKEIYIDIKNIKFVTQCEYYILFSFILKENNIWTKKGYEIAFEEKKLPLKIKNKKIINRVNYKDEKELKIFEDDKNIRVFNEKIDLNLNKLTGYLNGLDFGNGNILKDSIQLNFSRDLTDSDIYTKEINVMKYIFKKNNSLMKIIDIMSASNGDKFKIVVDFSNKKFENIKIVYTISPSGEVLIESEVIPKQSIKKFGIKFKLLSSYNNIKYFGKGPKENYDDRKEGAKTGIYEMKVEDLNYNYTRSQENGNRTEVRWVSLNNDENQGILVEAASSNLINFKAQPDAKENLDYINLHVDYKQSGLGGDYRLKEPLDKKYRINTGEKHYYSFIIKRL